MYPMCTFWIVIFLVMLMIEAGGAALVTIWFALGAAAAALASLAGASVAIQTAVFLAVSILTLVLFRKVCLKKIVREKQEFGPRRIIGKSGTVKTDIVPAQKGEIEVDFECWPAITRNDSAVPAGSTVRVVDIEGIKAVVEPDSGRQQ